jgi:hypothetical protein
MPKAQSAIRIAAALTTERISLSAAMANLQGNSTALFDTFPPFRPSSWVQRFKPREAY